MSTSYNIKVKKKNPKTKITTEVEGSVNPFNVKVKKDDGESVEIPIKGHTVTKGKGQGKIYLGPDFNQIKGLDWFLNLWEEQSILDMFKSKFRNFCANITREAAFDSADDKGENFDEQKFIQNFNLMFEKLSQRGESVAGLKMRRMELLGELGNLDDTAEDYQTSAMAILSELKRIQLALEAKKTDDEEESEEEKEAVTA